MKTLLPGLATLGTLIFLVTACGGDESASTAKWGCDKISSANACLEYTGSQWTGANIDIYKQTCTTDGGTVVTACTSTNAVAKCLQYSGIATEQTIIYYTGANLTTAETACTLSGGTWTLI